MWDFIFIKGFYLSSEKHFDFFFFFFPKVGFGHLKYIRSQREKSLKQMPGYCEVAIRYHVHDLGAVKE